MTYHPKSDFLRVMIERGYLADCTDYQALDEAFLKGAQARGLAQLKGHRIVGGMRASIYNAMPLEGVQALTAFMADFARRHG